MWDQEPGSIGGMINPQDQWHGKCFLYNDEVELYAMLDLSAASAPVRIVTAREVDTGTAIWDNDGYPVGPTPDTTYDTWLLIGSPVKVPLERHWSAIYQLEMEDV